MEQQIRDELVALDKAIYAGIARTRTPALDKWLARLSFAANFSLIWMVIAITVRSIFGRRGKRAALGGVVSIGVTSALVNLVSKRVYNRERPDRDSHDLDRMRMVAMPKSKSFPSGHSASAFAFAAAVGAEIPLLAPPVTALAAGVAYSRVHTGLHYPSDVLVGSILGWTVGRLVGVVLRRWR